MIAYKPKLSIGPITEQPSWMWWGEFLSNSLSRDFDCRFFSAWDIPESDIILFIKHHPNDMECLGIGSEKMLYMPIDIYHSSEEITQDASFLKKLHGVIVQNERLQECISKYNKNIHFIDHPNRFGFRENKKYSEEGPILWVGGYENLPFLLKYFENHPAHEDLLIVTNFNDPRAVRTAFMKAHELEVAMSVKDMKVNGIKMILWSHQNQSQAMKEARAALDIKGDEFHQFTKPPTKAQKYICAGIPFAANNQCYAVEYFENRGLDIPEPQNINYWLSSDYWNLIQKESKKLSSEISIKKIANQFTQLLNRLI